MLWLRNHNMSVYRLSKITDIPLTTCTRIAKGGMISFENAYKIAQALEISLDQLYQEMKEPTNK